METMRRMVFGVLLVGMAGILAELLLTGHTEEAWQWAPVVLLIVAMPATLLVAARPSAWAVILMRVLMLLFMAAGLLGTYFHFHENGEFVAELSPGLSGFAYFYETMTRQTPPPLAPGTMIMLGLLGLVACYRISGSARPRTQGE